MVGLLERIKKKTSAKALFNIQFNVVGWERGFRHVDEFRCAARKLEEIGSERKFTVYSDGRLVHGLEKGLHSFCGEIDLREDHPRYEIHIHYFKGDVEHISTKGNNLVLKDILVTSPRYTLEGLYSTLPNEKMSTRIGALKTALQEHVGYEFKSIAKRKDTRLKLLENAYRRRVSNQ